VPSIGARSRLIATGINPDGTAEVPPVDQPMQASYLDWAPELAPVHPVIIYGHVNGRDAQDRSTPGIFADLADVEVGEVIDLVRANGTLANYLVTRVERAPKDVFPTQAVYQPTRLPEIRLITCDGEFDPELRSYRDNLVVFGKLNP